MNITIAVSDTDKLSEKSRQALDSITGSFAKLLTECNGQELNYCVVGLALSLANIAVVSSTQLESTHILGAAGDAINAIVDAKLLAMLKGK